MIVSSRPWCLRSSFGISFECDVFDILHFVVTLTSDVLSGPGLTTGFVSPTDSLFSKFILGMSVL